MYYKKLTDSVSVFRGKFCLVGSFAGCVEAITLAKGFSILASQFMCSLPSDQLPVEQVHIGNMRWFKTLSVDTPKPYDDFSSDLQPLHDALLRLH